MRDSSGNKMGASMVIVYTGPQIAYSRRAKPNFKNSNWIQKFVYSDADSDDSEDDGVDENGEGMEDEEADDEEDSDEMEEEDEGWQNINFTQIFIRHIFCFNHFFLVSRCNCALIISGMILLSWRFRWKRLKLKFSKSFLLCVESRYPCGSPIIICESRLLFFIL